MGLADLFGIADLHCRKVESTKWLTDGQTDVRSRSSFPLRFAGGQLEFVMQAFEDYSKL